MIQEEQIPEAVLSKPCIIRGWSDGGGTMNAALLWPRFKYRVSAADDLSVWYWITGATLQDIIKNNTLKILNISTLSNGMTAFPSPFNYVGGLEGNKDAKGSISGFMRSTEAGSTGKVTFAGVEFEFECVIDTDPDSFEDWQEGYDGRFSINNKEIAVFRSVDLLNPEKASVDVLENKTAKGDYVVPIYFSNNYNCIMYVKAGAKTYILIDGEKRILSF